MKLSEFVLAMQEEAAAQKALHDQIQEFLFSIPGKIQAAVDAAVADVSLTEEQQAAVLSAFTSLRDEADQTITALEGLNPNPPEA